MSPTDLDLSGFAASLPPDHDDDDGCFAGRVAAGIGVRDRVELRRPLGITIVGGLILAISKPTRDMTPVIYLFFDRLARRFSGEPQVAEKTVPDSGPELSWRSDLPTSWGQALARR